MLAESGVTALEARVLAFLYRHSGALRLLATIDDAAQLLLQARPPFAATCFQMVGCASGYLHAMCCRFKEISYQLPAKS